VESVLDSIPPANYGSSYRFETFCQFWIYVSKPQLTRELMATGKQYRSRTTITDAYPENALLDNFEA